MIRSLFVAGVLFFAPVLGAQDAAVDNVEDGSLVVQAADPLAPEREIFLGEEIPSVSVDAPSPVSGFVVLRTVLLLILAAAAIYGVVYAVRKVSRPREAQDPHLRVLATTRLGQNRFVQVVALGTKGWLIGSGEGGISHIADITEQEALDALFLDESRRNAEANGNRWDFRSLLRRLGVQDRSVSAKRSPEGPLNVIQPDEIRRRSERLRGL
ncbi:MAG: flagellar biosynthetic protein FliO [Treponema sp.]|nr:flagellar biosynthetic protein FliO [Treponema sp.]